MTAQARNESESLAVCTGCGREFSAYDMRRPANYNAMRDAGRRFALNRARATNHARACDGTIPEPKVTTHRTSPPHKADREYDVLLDGVKIGEVGTSDGPRIWTGGINPPHHDLGARRMKDVVAMVVAAHNREDQNR